MNAVIGDVLDVVFPIFRFHVIPCADAFAIVDEAMSVSIFVIVTDLSPLSRHDPNFAVSSVVVACGMDILSLHRKYVVDVAISEDSE